MRDLFRTLVFISILGAATVVIVQILVDLVDTYLAGKNEKGGRYE